MNDFRQPGTDPTQDPDNYWLNVFYFNREDKRLLPPKRIAWMGWTINFANPYSILVLVLVLGAIFLMERMLGRA